MGSYLTLKDRRRTVYHLVSEARLRIYHARRTGWNLKTKPTHYYQMDNSGLKLRHTRVALSDTART